MTLPEGDQEIVRYLLDEMEDEERSMMEQSLVQDTAFFEIVAAVEDEMIMKYVRGEIQGRFKARFEQVYLGSPERRARVDSARELRDAVREIAASRQKSRGFWNFFPVFRMRWALASLAIAICVFSLVPMLKNGWVHEKKAAVQPVQQQFAIFLKPGRLRSGGGEQITVPHGIEQLHFSLSISGLPAYDRYQIVVGTPEHPRLFTGMAFRQGSSMTANVPAAQLAAGDYTLELLGVVPDGAGQPIETYFFRLAKN